MFGYFVHSASISFGPLELDFDAPWWFYLGALIIPFTGLIVASFYIRKAAKKGAFRLQRFPPWSYAVSILAVMIGFVFIVLPKLEDFYTGDGHAGGPPVVFVQPQKTFIGADVVACIPNIEGDADIDLPRWTIIGPELFNTPKPKFHALVRLPVGIDDFDKVVRSGWTEGVETRQVAPQVFEEVYVLRLTVPEPRVLDRYGPLFEQGKKNKLTSKAFAEEFGEALERCGGPSRFDGGSAGGILYNGANMVAGWFGKADQSDYNTLNKKAVDFAYELANKPDDKSFNGKSAIQQAKEVTTGSLEELIRSLNASQIAQYEAQGKKVEVEVVIGSTAQ